MEISTADIDRLYDRYSRRLYHTSLRIVGDAMEAEEIMHDTLLKLLNRPEIFPEKGRAAESNPRIEAWLVKVCVRASIDAIRRHKTVRRLFPDVELTGRTAAEAEARVDSGWNEYLNDASRETSETVGRIRRAIGTLPSGGRLILSLLLFEGYDPQEVAGITGLKSSSVRSQYVRAKVRLLEILKENG